MGQLDSTCYNPPTSGNCLTSIPLGGAKNASGRMMPTFPPKAREATPSGRLASGAALAPSPAPPPPPPMTGMAKISIGPSYAPDEDAAPAVLSLDMPPTRAVVWVSSSAASTAPLSRVQKEQQKNGFYVLVHVTVRV
jgi:hypothetical protein